MSMNFVDAGQLVENLRKARDSSALHDMLLEISKNAGFSYFALTEHVNLRADGSDVINVVNYPDAWACEFRRKKLFGVDPVHRASNGRIHGFLWAEVPKLIPMTRHDHLIFETARSNGLGNGYTVPANVPGYCNGSVSFGMAAGSDIDLSQLPLLSFVGTAAFEAAQKMRYGARALPADVPRLTDRQLDCVALVAQGLTTIEISRVLNVSYETVVQHIKDAALRYGVSRRTTIAVRALFDGSLGFTDVIPRKTPQPWG